MDSIPCRSLFAELHLFAATWKRTGWFLLLVAAMLMSGKAGKAQTLVFVMGSLSVSFPSANPDTTPSIAAIENPILLSVTYVGIGHWAITALAAGDLQSGSNTIPISNISWTTTGSAFVSGTLSKTTPQAVTAGSRTQASATGTIKFFLQNKWTYPTGTYSQTITLTATAF